MALRRGGGGLGIGGRADATPGRGIAPPRSVAVLVLLTILAGCVAQPAPRSPPIALHEPGYLPAYPPREDLLITSPVEVRPIQETQIDLVQFTDMPNHSMFTLQAGDTAVCR